jgi:hypothetical protein
LNDCLNRSFVADDELRLIKWCRHNHQLLVHQARPSCCLSRLYDSTTTALHAVCTVSLTFHRTQRCNHDGTTRSLHSEPVVPPHPSAATLLGTPRCCAAHG